MNSIEILLVEDSPGDVRLTKEALKDSRITNNLHVVNDGEQALDYLFRRNEYANEPTPDLILLDLNLPRKNGMEVLKEIKSNPTTALIPVVMLTTSNSESDILKSYQLHVNSYVTKPVSYESFLQVIRSIEDFWLNIVKLPTQQNQFRINRGEN